MSFINHLVFKHNDNDKLLENVISAEFWSIQPGSQFFLPHVVTSNGFSNS
jgi:hypothetical protein